MRCCEYLRQAAAAQIVYAISRSRSILVGLGKVEGNAQANANQPFKCKAENSLAAYAT